MRTLAISVITLTLFGCATMTSNDADAAIRAAGPRFIDVWNRGDWDAVSRFYADDAVTMAPNAETARGSAAIKQTFSAFQPLKPQLSFSPDRIVQSCEVAYEYGTYQMRLTPPGAAAINDRGKYLTVWRRMPGGEWKIVADMFNTSLPAPGM